MPSSTVTPANPFEAARLSLINKLQTALKAPAGFSMSPVPSEFTTVADHIREAVAIFDEWLADLGHEISDNSTCKVDMRDFRTAFTDAADNAFYACDRSSEALIEEHDELMRAS